MSRYKYLKKVQFEYWCSVPILTWFSTFMLEYIVTDDAGYINISWIVSCLLVSHYIALSSGPCTFVTLQQYWYTVWIYVISLFSSYHKDAYIQCDEASLVQIYKAKLLLLKLVLIMLIEVRSTRSILVSNRSVL